MIIFSRDVIFSGEVIFSVCSKDSTEELNRRKEEEEQEEEQEQEQEQEQEDAMEEGGGCRGEEEIGEAERKT